MPEAVTVASACDVAALHRELQKTRNNMMQLAATCNTLCPGKVHAADFVEPLDRALNLLKGIAR